MVGGQLAKVPDSQLPYSRLTAKEIRQPSKQASWNHAAKEHNACFGSHPDSAEMTARFVSLVP
jgi:hypothetical protein